MTNDQLQSRISTRAQQLADEERLTPEWRRDHGWLNYNPVTPVHLAQAAAEVARECRCP